MEVNSDYARSVLENIAKLKNEMEKVTLVATRDQSRVSVHRVILAANSNFFATLFGAKITDCKNEIPLEGINGNMLNELVSFFYTGNLEVNCTNFREYLKIALKFELKSLQTKCGEFRSRRISINNCVDWLNFSDKHDMGNLHENALQMVCKEFENIPSLQMRKLDFENFEEVISSNRNTAPEELIFDRLVEWVEFDEAGRSRYAADLLKHIRLKHITAKALIEKVDPFSSKFHLIEFTKQECHDRLLNPRPFYTHRFGHEKAVFELHKDATGNSRIRRYNDGEDCWEKVITIFAEPPNPKLFCGIVFCDETFYILGGSTRDEEFSKSVDMFELKTNTRKKLPNMKVARDDFQPIVIDQFIYVFGGFDGERAITDCERFDMRLKKWKLLQPMPTARYAYSAAVMNGFIFVAGGCKHEDQVKRNLVQRYDPAKNEWTKVARVMDPRFEGVLVEWNGFLYAVGVNKAVERYDSVRDEWEQPDILDSGDAILTALPKWPQKLTEDDRQQIELRNYNFFDRLCAEDSQNLFLTDFKATN